jgi:hypothetical protein
MGVWGRMLSLPRSDFACISLGEKRMVIVIIDSSGLVCCLERFVIVEPPIGAPHKGKESNLANPTKIVRIQKLQIVLTRHQYPVFL